MVEKEPEVLYIRGGAPGALNNFSGPYPKWYERILGVLYMTMNKKSVPYFPKKYTHRSVTINTLTF